MSPVGVSALDRDSPLVRILISSSLLPLKPAKYLSFSVIYRNNFLSSLAYAFKYVVALSLLMTREFMVLLINHLKLAPVKHTRTDHTFIAYLP